MLAFSYICPNCVTQGEFPLEFIDGRWVCHACGRHWDERGGIPLFSKDRYWGEISEEESRVLLEKIDADGFAKAAAWLQSTAPDSFRFFFDPARADWRFGTQVKSTDRVLDVGCGMGGNTFALCDLVEQVVSFDLSLARVQFVKARAAYEGKTNIQAFVGDFMELPLPEGQFDLIIFNGILEWIGQSMLFEDPYAVQQWVLKKCLRLLRPGGRMYIGIENRFAFNYLAGNEDHIGLRFTSWMPRWLARPYCHWRIGKDYRTYTHGKPGYVKLMREAGFRDIRVLMPYPGYNDQRLLVPFTSIVGLRYAITYLMGKLSYKKKLVKLLSRIPGVLWIYRYFFFSYNIYGEK